jgi:hypothetical protein
MDASDFSDPLFEAIPIAVSAVLELWGINSICEFVRGVTVHPGVIFPGSQDCADVVCEWLTCVIVANYDAASTASAYWVMGCLFDLSPWAQHNQRNLTEYLTIFLDNHMPPGTLRRERVAGSLAVIAGGGTFRQWLGSCSWSTYQKCCIFWYVHSVFWKLNRHQDLLQLWSYTYSGVI